MLYMLYPAWSRSAEEAAEDIAENVLGPTGTCAGPFPNGALSDRGAGARSLKEQGSELGV